MKEEHCIRQLCETFEVSSSGYYDWNKRQIAPGSRAQEDQCLRQQIKVLHQSSHNTYGSPRLQQALAREGRHHGRNRIARLLREEGLCGRQKRRYRVITTDSRHDQPIAPNRLAQVPPPTGPNQIWVADITYIDTDEGWLYLAAVMDLYSRRIVGWSMSQQIDTALILSAWNMAVTHRQPPPGLIFHSDRGVQYASTRFRQALLTKGALASMSRKACCYDNAKMESFWSTLKLELVYRLSFPTRPEAKTRIFSFIETFYNSKRLHSALKFNSPVDFENQNN